MKFKKRIREKDLVKRLVNLGIATTKSVEFKIEQTYEITPLDFRVMDFITDFLNSGKGLSHFVKEICVRYSEHEFKIRIYIKSKEPEKLAKIEPLKIKINKADRVNLKVFDIKSKNPTDKNWQWQLKFKNSEEIDKTFSKIKKDHPYATIEEGVVDLRPKTKIKKFIFNLSKVASVITAIYAMTYSDWDPRYVIVICIIAGLIGSLTYNPD